MQRPLISIVICCHNRADMISQTLESVFAQRYRPVEVVVLDDGSTDGTAELMARFGDRLRYHYQHNQGVAHARTNAGRLAGGSLIAFQDDDDLMAPDRLELLYGALAAHPECRLAVGNLEVIGPDDTLDRLLASRTDTLTPPHYTIYPDGYDAVLWPRVPATNHTTLFRKLDADHINWFDPRYTIGAEDKDFFARLGRLGPVVHVERTVSYYRRGHASLSDRTQFSYFAALRLFENHLRDFPDDPEPIRNRLRERILLTLKAMVTLENKGVPVPPDVPREFARDALSLLQLRAKLDYYVRSLLTAPLSALVRKHLWRTSRPQR